MDHVHRCCCSPDGMDLDWHCVSRTLQRERTEASDGSNITPDRIPVAARTLGRT